MYIVTNNTSVTLTIQSTVLKCSYIYSYFSYMCAFISINISISFDHYNCIMHSKTCVKRPLKNRQNKDLMTNDSLMKVQSTRAEQKVRRIC